jgi:hypothetical protein
MDTPLDCYFVLCLLREPAPSDGRDGERVTGCVRLRDELRAGPASRRLERALGGTDDDDDEADASAVVVEEGGASASRAFRRGALAHFVIDMCGGTLRPDDDLNAIGSETLPDNDDRDTVSSSFRYDAVLRRLYNHVTEVMSRIEQAEAASLLRDELSGGGALHPSSSSPTPSHPPLPSFAGLASRALRAYLASSPCGSATSDPCQPPSHSSSSGVLLLLCQGSGRRADEKAGASEALARHYARELGARDVWPELRRRFLEEDASETLPLWMRWE